MIIRPRAETKNQMIKDWSTPADHFDLATHSLSSDLWDAQQSSNKISEKSSSSRSPGVSLRSQRKNLPQSVEDIEIIDKSTRPKKLRTRKASKKSLKAKNKSGLSLRSRLLLLEKKTYILGSIFMVLCLRFVFMERGLIDYHRTNQFIDQKKQQIFSLDQSNIELEKEIRLIKESPLYQRKMARKHLGVIGVGEYLVLFAEDSKDPSSDRRP